MPILIVDLGDYYLNRDRMAKALRKFVPHRKKSAQEKRNSILDLVDMRKDSK